MRLKVDFTSVDINNSYTTCSKSRNKSQMPDTAEENNLLPIQASNNTQSYEAATPLNLHSPLMEAWNWSPLAMPVRILLERNAISTTYETTS